MAKVRDRRLISTYGQDILDSGFYSIPNLILDYQQELDLTDNELMFYIKVTHFFAKKKINLKDLKMKAHLATLYRIRNRLIKKKYLEIIKLSKGNVVIYNWAGMIERLNNILDEEQKNSQYAKMKFAICENEIRNMRNSSIIYVKEGGDNDSISKRSGNDFAGKLMEMIKEVKNE